MSLVNQVTAMMAALRSISPTQQCFELAANKRDADAFELVSATRAATRNNRFAPWDIELQLLEAFLLLERGSPLSAQRTLRGAFRRIKAAKQYNSHEQAVLVRYAVSVLWLARGRREPSCLLVVRHLRTFDGKRVRSSILKHFPNPDEEADD